VLERPRVSSGISASSRRADSTSDCSKEVRDGSVRVDMEGEVRVVRQEPIFESEI
jgi:hypothetical protein